MRKILVATALLTAVIGLPTVTAMAEEPGALVLGQWQDGMWYPARVAKTDGDKMLVSFYDGDIATLDDGKVKDFDWKVGTKVECNWKRKGKYYPGKITEMTGEVLHVSYDDGDQEDTGIGRCRTK